MASTYRKSLPILFPYCNLYTPRGRGGEVARAESLCYNSRRKESDAGMTKAERLAELVALDVKIPQLTFNRKTIYTAEINALQAEILANGEEMNAEYRPEQYAELRPERQAEIMGRNADGSSKRRLFGRRKK